MAYRRQLVEAVQAQLTKRKNATRLWQDFSTLYEITNYPPAMITTRSCVTALCPQQQCQDLYLTLATTKTCRHNFFVKKYVCHAQVQLKLCTQYCKYILPSLLHQWQKSLHKSVWQLLQKSKNYPMIQQRQQKIFLLISLQIC